MAFHSDRIRNQTYAEPVRSVRQGEWQVELLPASPYEASYTTYKSVIGFAFDGQSGSHAYNSSKKISFHAKPNGLAFVPKGSDVYSQSEKGGEYLRLIKAVETSSEVKIDCRFNDVIDQRAIQAAHRLRQLLLQEQTADSLGTEYCLLELQACASTVLDQWPDVNQGAGHLSAAQLSRVDDYIEAHIDTRLRVEYIAKALSLSAGYFSREFKKVTGRSPHQYIVDRRVKRARGLLVHSKKDLSTIAFDCGFTSHSHMSATFGTCLGVSPRSLQTR